jgi:hypothetical protein
MGKAEYERDELMVGRKDTTILSGLNIVLTKLYQMDINENRYQMSSEDFFDRFSKGQLEDSELKNLD